MKATVVTVCRNAEREIEKTVQNVLSYKHDHAIEYIVIDGESTDRTLEILRKYEGKIDILISEPDSGIYDAMNKGIRMASGEFIGFLNSGDIYTENAIDDVMRCFQETHADVIYGHVAYMHDGKVKRIREAAKDSSEMLVSMVACHQGIFVKTEVQKKHEFGQKYQIAADRKMLLDLYLEGLYFERIDKVLAFYDDSGFSSVQGYKLSIENYRMTYEMLMDYPEFQGQYLAQTTDNIFLNEFWNQHNREKQKPDLVEKDFYSAKINPSKKIIIWGTGFYGNQARQLFIDLGYKVLYFIESSPGNVKKKSCAVFSPEEAPVEGDNEVLIIATRNYIDEIVDRLNTVEKLRHLLFFVFKDLIIECEKSRGKTIESILYGDQGKE